MPSHHPHLARVAAHLRARRGDIMAAWQRAVHRDPDLTTGTTLPRAQLMDHIPLLLRAYETTLDARATPAGSTSGPVDTDQPQLEANAVAHGLHRWQQGFGLTEVARELGRLNECVVAELDRCAAMAGDIDPASIAEARRLWAEVNSLELSASIGEYFRLQQLEADGHVQELEQAVDELRDMSRQRADWLHQAAHDLRGNMSVVLTATAGLTRTEVAEVPHYNFLRILDRNVLQLQQLLDDVLDLARLQSGKDRRRVGALDAARLLGELGADLQPLARQRGHALACTGPAPFLVEGDALKIRRIAQNLVLNAIRHTQHADIDVSWSDSTPDDPQRWVLTVRDTGPGLPAHATPLTDALEQATDAAPPPPSASTPPAPAPSSPPVPQPAAPGPARSGGALPPVGEGIGLTIVKRLAELLDATVEVQSTPGAGTRFRVLLPRRYVDKSVSDAAAG